MAAANITPTAQSDGILYANAVPITAQEVSLFGGSGAQAVDPIPVLWGQTIIVIVQLNVVGSINSNSTYVVLQTDLGDGVWIDVAWILFSALSGKATFMLSGGGIGNINNALQQSRAVGTAPGSNGSNTMTLGGRCQIVGKSTVGGQSSSPAPGVASGVQATIRYKLEGPR